MPPDSNAYDRELIARCLTGRPEAWEEFVRRYEPVLSGAIRSTLLRRTGRADPGSRVRGGSAARLKQMGERT